MRKIKYSLISLGCTSLRALVLTTVRTANRAVRFAPQTEPCPIPRFGLSQKPNRDATVRFAEGTNRGGSSGSPRFVIFDHGHLIRHFTLFGNTLPPCLFTLLHVVHGRAFCFSGFSNTVANCQVAQFHRVLAHGRSSRSQSHFGISFFFTVFMHAFAFCLLSLFRVVL